MNSIRERVAVQIGRKHYRTKITKGDHEIPADEPLDFWNSDAGMTPYDLLLAVLGSCASMTMCMYADNKEWSLGSVTVRLCHDKIHMPDCEQCETNTGHIDREEKEPIGDLDSQKQQNLQVNTECYLVNCTLKSEVILANASSA